MEYVWLQKKLKYLNKLGSKVLRMAKESQPSVYKEGRLDTPVDASQFLKRFFLQNSSLLKQLNVIKIEF